MVPSILIALAVPPAAPAFAEPIGNADLAAVHALPAVVAATTPNDAARWSALGLSPAIGEQMDNWWGDTGLTMIAAAVRPAPTVADLSRLADLDALRQGALTIRYQQTASTRP